VRERLDDHVVPAIIAAMSELAAIQSIGAVLAGRLDPETTAIKDKKRLAQCRLARLIASERAPTNTRLEAQVASKLNQLCDTNLRPRYR